MWVFWDCICTIPHCAGLGPADEWFYWFVVFLGEVVLGIVVLVGNSWALSLSVRELSPVDSNCCPRTFWDTH